MVKEHVVSRTVEFPLEGGGTATAFDARPTCGGACPGVLLIQEWWGLNDHIKDVACRLAQEGFIAVAPDLYEGKVTKDPEQAGKWMQEMDPEHGVKILKGAMKFLQEKEPIYAEHIAVMGFCMGGSYALLFAAREPSLKAAVAFYGDIPQPASQLRNVKCPVLFFGAAKDHWINPGKVAEIKKAFQENGVSADVRVYPDADHAFFNDTRPEVYNPAAAHDTWTRTLGFFNRTLKS
jgi:carboxymethylenebutenolidase